MKISILNGFIVCFLILALISCKNDDHPKEPEEGFAFMTVGQDFKFNSFHPVRADLLVVPASPGELYHVFKIYDGPPAAGGKLINQGRTNENFAYSVSFQLPERITEVYIENSNPEGIYELVNIPVNSNFIAHTFNTNNFLNPRWENEKVVIADPGCGEECKEEISGSYASLTLSDGTYCVPEGSVLTVNGQLTFEKKVTLVICGTANLRNIASNDNRRSAVYVSSPGLLEISGDLNVGQKIDYYNFGSCIINGNLNTTSPFKFYNYSGITIKGSVNNNTENFQNEGVFSVEGDFNNNNEVKMNNYGSFYLDGNFNNNGNSKVFNYCYLEIGKNLVINSQVRNFSYIKVSGNTVVNGGSTLFFNTGSLLESKNLTNNGRIKSTGNGYSKINISETTVLNGESSVEYKMDLCDYNGIEINNGTLGSKVVFCETTIPESACNPGSEGGAGIIDTDEDGVVDTEDLFPEDPKRAFTSYYPNQVDYGTFAFEDLWPGMGDYDFNDLVLDFQYEINTNADNKIVDIIISSHVKAAGASLDNGFGISIPVPPSYCESITGYLHVMGNLNMNPKGYENGHNLHTVAILYDAVNSIYNSSIFNTVPGGNAVITDTVEVTITFANPQLALGNEPYNPFIYVNQERGKEIHLIDHQPTDLADAQYFGTGHDDSEQGIGRWYVTESNLPWVIEIPVSFDYPVEKADILTAYLKFASWAESSGNEYQDWYVEQPGFRNPENIYGAE